MNAESRFELLHTCDAYLVAQDRLINMLAGQANLDVIAVAMRGSTGSIVDRRHARVDLSAPQHRIGAGE